MRQVPKCVFNPQVECLYPALRHICRDDLNAIKAIEGVSGEIPKEEIARLHDTAGDISPTRYCPIYPPTLKVGGGDRG